MGKKPRNWVGELVIRLPKPVKKRVKPLIKQGQIRSKRAPQEFKEKLKTYVWGKKRGGKHR